VGPGQPTSTVGIGTFKGAANHELPESETLRVSVAEGSEGARQVSLSVADVPMNAARRPAGHGIAVFVQPTTQPTKCDVLYDLRGVEANAH
jgi:hypothetical protein